MDKWENIRNCFKTDLEKIGFKTINSHECEGRIPQNGLINAFYIQVKLDYENYPLNSPRIILTSINECTELFKCVPKTWRHLDEQIYSNPLDSVFYICCLHNWTAKEIHNADFVYNRILSWLTANTEGKWCESDDLPTWRILPNNSEIMLFITKKYLDYVGRRDGYACFLGHIIHTPYRFKNGKECTAKRLGNVCSLSDIDFAYQKKFFSKPYKYVLHSSADEEETGCLVTKLFSGKCQETKGIVIKLETQKIFKSVYQLFEITNIYNNDILRNLNKKDKNIIVIYVYTGDNGRIEVVAFLIDVNSFKKGILDKLTYKVFQVQAIEEPDILIDLNIALLGAGSLGSQIARILVDKRVKQIKISDPDTLTITNLGFHELTPISLGAFKTIHLAIQLQYRTICHFPIILPAIDDIDAIKDSDVIIVAVGSNASFDRLAFDVLKDVKTPIIWCWVSEYSILQEIVITSGNNGCLNCYYLMCKNDNELNKIHKKAKEEIDSYPKYQVDACGDPHVPSQWERTVFLASQIVSLLTFYSKNNRFPFEYITYYWPMSKIYPDVKTGYVNSNAECFCRRK